MDKKYLLYIGLILLGAALAPQLHKVPVVGSVLAKVPA